jgi:Na+/H+ antiporter NhaD/arsenite permease-like protein
MTAFVLVVFTIVYLGMAAGRLPGLAVDRTGVALIGAIGLVLAGAMDGQAVLAAIDFPTLIVLFGLMVLSAQFAACGFYTWCAARIAATPVSPVTLLALVTLVGGGLSAVLANDVVVFAMTPMLVLGLTRAGLDARPYVLALAAGANAGSAATVIGNPQNILIGSVGGLDFWAFSALCGPPAVAALGIVFAVVAVVWRGRLRLGERRPHPAAETLEPDRGGILKAGIATAVLLVLFATPLPHIEGVLLVAGALLVSRRLATRRLLGYVDWHLLVLFAGLFVVTAALTATGLPAALLEALDARGWRLDALAVLAPLVVVGANTIGNVPLVVLLLGIVEAPTPELLYALALVSTLAGNLLLTGSLANIIAIERAAEVGLEIGFLEHARIGIPTTVLSLATALLWLAWHVPA